MGHVDGSSVGGVPRGPRRAAALGGAGLASAYVAALVFGFLPGVALPLLRQGPRVIHLLLYRQMAASVLVAALLFPAGIRSSEMAERLKLKGIRLAVALLEKEETTAIERLPGRHGHNGKAMDTDSSCND
ncbi:unnamed protein product [Urochloa humidicola]